MLTSMLVLAFAFSWVGHACIWTALLNNLYGRPLPKALLRWWRHFTALILMAYPLVLWSGIGGTLLFQTAIGENLDISGSVWNGMVTAYTAICLAEGAFVFPAITLARALRKQPAAVFSEATRSLDLWPELGPKLIGDHKMAALTRLPGNGVFRLDITDITLGLTGLPHAWDGLTLLVLSDLHFQGTPSRLYFERLVEELLTGPPADVVCLLGDFVDSNSHHEWIVPILGRLTAREAKLAILGNHDYLYDVEGVRRALAEAGYTVLGNGWRALSIRGEACVGIGHEGPWARPGPDLAAAPANPFRLCLSHTPDNFYWGQRHGVRLMLCGHVHGGGIRVPLIGSIFMPSVFGRRFDTGVFQELGTVMVVGRGISGREPIRFRCDPQAIRITLRA